MMKRFFAICSAVAILFVALALASHKPPRNEEKIYEEYCKRMGRDTFRAAAKIDVNQGIGEFEAFVLSFAYFDAHVSGCGAVKLPHDNGDTWVSDTLVGVGAEPGPKIIVEKKTGITYSEGKPKVDPKTYLELVTTPAKSGEPTRQAANMSRSIPLSFERATLDDAASLAALHTVVADHLTGLHGQGPWSSKTSEKGVLFAMRTSQVFVARLGGEIVGTWRLATKKPWAIDTKYFSPCQRPLYLLAMAITPARQRKGIGQLCLQEALRIAKAWPADAIRLDAYDAKAGGGGFYARCGWTEKGRVCYRGAPLIYYEFVLK